MDPTTDLTALDNATRAYAQARDDLIATIVELLRAGHSPAGLADHTPWSQRRLRTLAREAGAEPATRGRKPRQSTTTAPDASAPPEPPPPAPRRRTQDVGPGASAGPGEKGR
ncbi:MAG TPA: hypothetical protein VGH72_07575 [Pseudonocardia sp.]|jgi:hypothetical protein